MRASGDPDWYEYRFCVPLTGREPILGRLKTRLRARKPGWGWVSLAGPPGAGVSRLLADLAARIRAAGEPPLLHLRATPGARVPMPSVHAALRPLFPQPAGPTLERALRAVFPCGRDETRVLASWLGEQSSGRGSPALDPALVRALIERLSPVGPVLVDDLQHMDEATLRVLMPSAQGRGFGVVAGVSGPCPVLSEEAPWRLEPLGAAQVELLLRRWLRHPATARRLAGALTERCEGWPGRVVESVRRLARSGHLARRERGIVVERQPTRWPDGRPSANGFLEWVRTQGASARRVLEIAAVQGPPDDVHLLADAAGVKRAFVEAMIAEAVASRGGLAAGRFFATRAKRRAFCERLPAPRRDAARERLEASWARRESERGSTLDDDLRRLRLLACGAARENVEASLQACLRRLPVERQVRAWHLDALVEAAAVLPPSHPDVARVAHRLWHAGREQQARSLAGAAALAVHPTASQLLMQARHREAPEARALLAAGLSSLEPHHSATQFDAWSVLADLHLGADACVQAREAWRRAAAVHPRADLERRGRWHEGLARCAVAMGRLRLAAAHRRRAVRLRLAHGDVHAAGALLLALGDSEIRQGRFRRALSPLRRSAHILRLMGDAQGTAEAHFLSGRVHAWLHDYDGAVDELAVALATAESGALGRLLPRIHLALAASYRGCADLARERHHAEMAAGLATTALGRVQAAAVLARADLRAGVPGAEHLLVRCERDLRMAGFSDEASRARAALLDARLRAGDQQRAREFLGVGPAKAIEHLAAARLDLATGRLMDACSGFQLLGADGTLPADLRATCYAHLADALRRRGMDAEARTAAVAASALLQVTRRSRADDARLHDVLARVFRGVGEYGRAVGHRSAARRGMRALASAANDPRERRRLMRSFWRRDPRPRRTAV